MIAHWIGRSVLQRLFFRDDALVDGALARTGTSSHTLSRPNAQGPAAARLLRQRAPCAEHRDIPDKLESRTEAAHVTSASGATQVPDGGRGRRLNVLHYSEDFLAAIDAEQQYTTRVAAA